MNGTNFREQFRLRIDIRCRDFCQASDGWMISEAHQSTPARRFTVAASGDPSQSSSHQLLRGAPCASVATGRACPSWVARQRPPLITGERFLARSSLLCRFADSHPAMARPVRRQQGPGFLKHYPLHRGVRYYGGGKSAVTINQTWLKLNSENSILKRIHGFSRVIVVSSITINTEFSVIHGPYPLSIRAIPAMCIHRQRC